MKLRIARKILRTPHGKSQYRKSTWEAARRRRAVGINHRGRLVKNILKRLVVHVATTSSNLIHGFGDRNRPHGLIVINEPSTQTERQTNANSNKP